MSPDKNLYVVPTQVEISIGMALNESTLSAPAKDALTNPQMPQYPATSWMTEVLTVATRSSDPWIRRAALDLLGWCVLRRTDSVATSNYLRLFEDMMNDSSVMVRRSALFGLGALWERGHLEGARESIAQVAQSNSDALIRWLAGQTLRRQAWPYFGGTETVQNAPPVDWEKAIEYTTSGE